MTGLGINPSSPEDEQLLTAIRVAADSFMESIIDPESGNASLPPANMNSAILPDPGAECGLGVHPASKSISATPDLPAQSIAFDYPAREAVASPETTRSSGFAGVATGSGHDESTQLAPEQMARNFAEECDATDWMPPCLSDSGLRSAVIPSKLSTSNRNLAAELSDAIFSPVTDSVLFGVGSGDVSNSNSSMGDGGRGRGRGGGGAKASFWGAAQHALSVSSTSTIASDHLAGQASAVKRIDAALSGEGDGVAAAAVLESSPSTKIWPKQLPATDVAVVDRKVRAWGSFTIGSLGEAPQVGADAAAAAAAAAVAAGENAASLFRSFSAGARKRRSFGGEVDTTCGFLREIGRDRDGGGGGDVGFSDEDDDDDDDDEDDGGDDNDDASSLSSSVTSIASAPSSTPNRGGGSAAVATPPSSIGNPPSSATSTLTPTTPAEGASRRQPITAAACLSSATRSATEISSNSNDSNPASPDKVSENDGEDAFTGERMAEPPRRRRSRSVPGNMASAMAAATESAAAASAVEAARTAGAGAVSQYPQLGPGVTGSPSAGARDVGATAGTVGGPSISMKVVAGKQRCWET